MTAKNTLLQALALLVLATSVGLATNSVRQKGISIPRNYFPKTAVVVDPPPEPIPDPGHTPPGDTAADNRPVHEFETVTLDQAYDYFALGDPSIVFVDARNDEHYRSSHIPKAVQFFHYYPEKYVNRLRFCTEDAQTIIVYCTGGDCEDSIQAARYLATELEPPLHTNEIYIFEEGMAKWCAAGYPYEPENGTCEHD